MDEVGLGTRPRVDPDAEAVRRARAGDEGAFESLVRRYGNEVYSVCRRHCRDPHEAEDLAQEAILRAYRGLRDFRADSTFRTWLFRIVVNVCRNWWARTRRQESATEEPAIPDPSGPDEQVERLRREIERLPDRQRLVVSLRFFGGLDPVEIGEILDMSPVSVRVNLTHARKQLSERLRMEDR